MLYIFLYNILYYIPLVVDASSRQSSDKSVTWCDCDTHFRSWLKRPILERQARPHPITDEDIRCWYTLLCLPLLFSSLFFHRLQLSALSLPLGVPDYTRTSNHPGLQHESPSCILTINDIWIRSRWIRSKLSREMSRVNKP